MAGDATQQGMMTLRWPLNGYTSKEKIRFPAFVMNSLRLIRRSEKLFVIVSVPNMPELNVKLIVVSCGRHQVPRKERHFISRVISQRLYVPIPMHMHRPNSIHSTQGYHQSSHKHPQFTFTEESRPVRTAPVSIQRGLCSAQLAYHLRAEG